MMTRSPLTSRAALRPAVHPTTLLALSAGLFALSGCASGASTGAAAPAPAAYSAAPPSPDPRLGLKAGVMDAGEAIWNLRKVSSTPPPKEFLGGVNSDLAFTGRYAIQGNFNGFQVWDIADPARPALVKSFVCPASQSDVSVYKNLLFVSGEGLEGRLDCGTEAPKGAVSKERLRGIRIFDITDIRNPKYVANVQTCRGSHTHTVVEDPKDAEHVYIYVSGSASVRPEEELPGCSRGMPDDNPNSALFRIEVIKVPVAHPERAAIVNSPRIFQDLVEPPSHGLAPDDKAAIEAAKARGAFVVEMEGQAFTLPERMTKPMLDSVVKARNGSGAPTAADSAALRGALPAMIARMMGRGQQRPGPRPGPTQCHDITVYPAIGLAGGACEGYGLLLDISDVANPKRIAAVADSNFSYWHSATFNNAGTKVLFSDEWGGGMQAKCRASDPKEWGADAIFTIDNRNLTFRSYYKLPVAQTPQENCVAHNGSMLPIPGRDIMVQAWYQGGISVFDWTDPARPREIAFHDRGPNDATRTELGGPWSVYWYNGVLVSSEIVRGLDIFELTPSAHLSQNEIDASKTVRLAYLNAQGQPRYVWPASFALARAYVDQLERSGGLSGGRVASVRSALAGAEQASGGARQAALAKLAGELDGDARGSKDADKVKLLADAVRKLGTS